jgi:hypothetical protein
MSKQKTLHEIIKEQKKSNSKKDSSLRDPPESCQVSPALLPSFAHLPATIEKEKPPYPPGWESSADKKAKQCSQESRTRQTTLEF